MNQRKSLFICTTPLQLIIAAKIIEVKKLTKQSCFVFFYTSFDSDKDRYYYDRLNEKCSSGFYYVWKPNFPIYIFDARRIMKELQCQDFYFAAIDSVFVHLALSMARRPNIFTFDDGTANVNLSSTYHKKYKFTRKRLIFYLLGARYTPSRIKSATCQHYTIYPGLKNIVDNVLPIPVFDAPVKNVENTLACSVFLGTVLAESFPKDYDFYEALGRVAKRIDGDVFYIPHPREKKEKLVGFKVIESKLVAEEIIVKLLNDYGCVKLYGFSSSAQLNMLSVEPVKLFLLASDFESQSAKALRKLVCEASIRAVEVVNMDDARFFD